MTTEAADAWADALRKTVKYKVEVIADNSGQWVGNGMVFDTTEEAATYAKDSFSRWTAVKEWRVVKVEQVT
tara:strand:+ start:898 stop:1110 length:213 start_codon:yes stop_codon:yes gene_type:complete